MKLDPCYYSETILSFVVREKYKLYQKYKDGGFFETDKSKINWFGRTVKPLVELGLVKQIRVGRRGYNATFIVIDLCELELIKK